jgi:hypothetical protein
MRIVVKTTVVFEFEHDNFSDILNVTDKFSYKDNFEDENVKIKSGELENRLYGTIVKVEDVIVDGKYL